MIIGGCSTGYGEDLIKAAFHMDAGIIETIAHYAAAKHISKVVPRLRHSSYSFCKPFSTVFIGFPLLS